MNDLRYLSRKADSGAEPALSNKELAARTPPRDADLSTLQEWMALMVRHPRSLSKNPELEAAASEHFTGNSRLTPGQQIDLYREQFWLRHTSSLVEDFKGLAHFLMQKEWDELMVAYLTKRPPGHRFLGRLGDDLARFIDDEMSFPHLDLAVDMARVDFAYQDIFDELDAPRLTPEKLQAVPDDAWENATLKVNPALRLLHLRYPAARYRRALLSKEASRHAPPSPEKQSLVVYRRDGKLWDKPVSPLAALFLQALIDGKPLGGACEAVITAAPDSEQDLESLVGNSMHLWGQLDWIVDVSLD